MKTAKLMLRFVPKMMRALPFTIPVPKRKIMTFSMSGNSCEASQRDAHDDDS